MNNKKVDVKDSEEGALSSFLKSVNLECVDLDELQKKQDNFLDGEYKQVDDLSELGNL